MQITIVGSKDVYLWHKARNEASNQGSFFFSNENFIHPLKDKNANLKPNQFRFRFIDIPVVDFNPNLLGNANKVMGESCLKLLNAGVDFIKREANCALVTAPINKKAISLVDRKFTGHTGFLAEKFNLKDEVSMTFFSSAFNLVLTTTHIPLREVAKAINEKNLKKALTHALEIKKLLRDQAPVLVLGLNPHAGEEGLLGEEEGVIAKAMSSFPNPEDFLGPVAPDTAFIKTLIKTKGSFPKVVVAHYHDQGLIPLKTLAFNEAVNVTWGLPFVRTSVDHGTGYDLVGKNQASPWSFYFAVKQAIDLLEVRETPA